ncbi:MAG: GLUG motif-containing protein [Phycisphaerales bacterium]
MATLRNHRVVFSVLAMVLILAACDAVSAVEFAGGTGEPNDPYQIATAEQLAGIGSDPDLLAKCYVLVDDIDLDPNLPGGKVFSGGLIAPEVRGSHGGPYGYFQGVFDGGGHVVRNLTIHADKAPAAGLFGYIDSLAQIRNVGIDGIDIRRSGVGREAFVGGGLAAVNAGGAIFGCYVTGKIAETYQFTPYPWDANESDCVGGLVGQNNGLVHGCYAIADVQGDGIVGGLVGLNTGAVRFCFAAGAPYGSGWVGGLAGRNDAGTVVHSYWDSEAGDAANGDAGTAKTSAELMSRETYEPWRYTGSWTLDDGRDYPHLLWEQAAGTPIGDVPSGYAGGSGASDDPFRIDAVEQFVAIAYRPADFDKSFALAADLDFNGVDSDDVLPIGLKQLAFSGRFDGQSHSLANLSIVRPEDQCVGVFGIVGPANVFPRNETIDYSINDNDDFSWGFSTSGSRFDTMPPTTALIQNLHLDNVAVVGREFVGGLVGMGQIAAEDCSVTGKITGQSLVGGLIGRAMRGSLSRCSVDAQVTGEFAVGGLAGATWRGTGSTLEDCLVRGSVTGQLHTGGLIGYADGPRDEPIRRCSAACDVRGRYVTGGCFGLAVGSNISMCVARGTVTGDSFLGGFAGQISYATVIDSYCISDVSGQRSAGGFVGWTREGSIARCYAASTVSVLDADPNSTLSGGFVGFADSSSRNQADACIVEAENCFWDTGVAGPTTAVGNCLINTSFIRGLTTAQMQTASTFVVAGWDFENVWTICEGRDYPRLRWEEIGCDE